MSTNIKLDESVANDDKNKLKNILTSIKDSVDKLSDYFDNILDEDNWRGPRRDSITFYNLYTFYGSTSSNLADSIDEKINEYDKFLQEVISSTFEADDSASSAIEAGVSTSVAKKTSTNSESSSSGNDSSISTTKTTNNKQADTGDLSNDSTTIVSEKSSESNGNLSASDFKNVGFVRYNSNTGNWYNDSITSSNSESANTMYNVLKDEGLNDAQIAGIMGNAFTESGFDNNLKSKDTNGVYSYGCFQNNEKGKYVDFVKYCNNNGYSTTSTEAQTRYLVKVMRNDEQFMNVSDTSAGVETASERVRKYYEVSGSSSTRIKNSYVVYDLIS